MSLLTIGKIFLDNKKTKIKITDMNYKNYTIEPDNTGYAPKSMTYGIYKDEESIERCETVEECKNMIDEIILENFEWTNESVIDFVNWFLDLHKLSFRYKLENMQILESFMMGDDFTVWH